MLCLSDHLALLLLNALECAAVYVLFFKPLVVGVDELAGPFARLRVPWLGPFEKPLYACLTCMASVHSFPFFWIAGAHHLGWTSIFEWGLYVLALAGANTIVKGHV